MCREFNYCVLRLEIMYYIYYLIIDPNTFVLEFSGDFVLNFDLLFNVVRNVIEYSTMYVSITFYKLLSSTNLLIQTVHSMGTQNVKK